MLRSLAGFALFLPGFALAINLSPAVPATLRESCALVLRSHHAPDSVFVPALNQRLTDNASLTSTAAITDKAALAATHDGQQLALPNNLREEPDPRWFGGTRLRRAKNNPVTIKLTARKKVNEQIARVAKLHEDVGTDLRSLKTRETENNSVARAAYEWLQLRFATLEAEFRADAESDKVETQDKSFDEHEAAIASLASDVRQFREWLDGGERSDIPFPERLLKDAESQKLAETNRFARQILGEELAVDTLEEIIALADSVGQTPAALLEIYRHLRDRARRESPRGLLFEGDVLPLLRVAVTQLNHLEVENSVNIIVSRYFAIELLGRSGPETPLRDREAAVLTALSLEYVRNPIQILGSLGLFNHLLAAGREGFEGDQTALVILTAHSYEFPNRESRIAGLFAGIHGADSAQSTASGIEPVAAALLVRSALVFDLTPEQVRTRFFGIAKTLRAEFGLSDLSIARFAEVAFHFDLDANQITELARRIYKLNFPAIRSLAHDLSTLIFALNKYGKRDLAAMPLDEINRIPFLALRNQIDYLYDFRDSPKVVGVADNRGATSPTRGSAPARRGFNFGARGHWNWDLTPNGLQNPWPSLRDAGAEDGAPFSADQPSDFPVLRDTRDEPAAPPPADLPPLEAEN